MAKPSPSARPPLGQVLLDRVSAVAAPWLRPRVDGFVDRVVANEVFGWALDRRRPGRRVLVVARAHGQVVGETLADLPRRDLESTDKGDGRCGFRLKLPSDLSEAALASLSIEASIGARRLPLKRAKRFKTQEAALAPGGAHAAHGPTAGFLERCSGGVLKGWAVNPNNPEATPEVDVFEGELFLGAVVASIDRPRLRESGAPFGARGFEFQLPSDRPVAPAALRARIAGTRVELRQSRVFLEEALGYGPVSGPEASGPTAAQSVAAAVARARASRSPLAFLLCGPGDTEAVGDTLRSLAAQDLDGAPVAILGRPTETTLGTTAIAPGDPAALSGWLETASLVAVLAPGQSAHPALARRLIEARGGGDVLVWAADDRPPPGPDPDLAVALGAPSNGLAVRAEILGRLPAAAWAAIGVQGLSALEAVLASAGLCWATLDAPLVSRPPGMAPAATAPQRPRRLSLAVWSDWTEAPPPALKTLLAGCAGFDVEVLCPAPSSPDLARRIEALRGPGLRSLRLRLVDIPADPEGSGVWRAMGRAATGQVVIFCHGAVEAPPEVIGEVAGWAHRADVGAVTVPIADEEGFTLAGLALDPIDGAAVSGFEAGRTGLDRPVLAAPAAFMAVSRSGLAQTDGLGFGSAFPAAADLSLGVDLRHAGRRSVLLAGRTAAAPAEILRSWRRRPASHARPEDGPREPATVGTAAQA